MKITNKAGINPMLAVAMLYSDYDHSFNPKEISATTIIKSPRRVAMKIKKFKTIDEMDVSDMTAMFIGNSAHSALQRVWESADFNWKPLLKQLGHSTKEINRILINPTKKQLKKARKKDKKTSPVYLEQREKMKIGKFITTGKYDNIYEGYLRDLKTTSVYKVVKVLKEVLQYNAHTELLLDKQISDHKYLELIHEDCPNTFDFVMQGSIYTLLNKEKITSSYFGLQIVMKDWYSYMAEQEGFPKTSIIDIELRAFAPKATKRWIKRKHDLVSKLKNMNIEDMPFCTPNELWQGAPTYKWFASNTAKRAGKVFGEDSTAAYKFMRDVKFGKGMVKVILPPVKACNYCEFRESCDQYKMLKDTDQLAKG